MYELRYVGRSPYGVSVYLFDGRSIVTVSRRTPFKLGENLSEREIRYYKSLVKCDIELVVPEIDPEDIILTPPEIIEEVVEVEVEEPVVDLEAIYNMVVDELTEDDVDAICDQLGFSTRKRNKGTKLWDLLNSIHSDDAVKILLNR